MNRVVLLILNTFTLILVILMNYLAGTGQINDQNVGEVSRQYETLIAPAGYAFSIWGLIYLLLISFVVFQWIVFFKRTNREIIDKTGIYFIVANLANTGWLYLWLNDHIGFSVLAMLVLLLSLIVLVFRLDLEIWDATVRIIFFVWWPVVIYFGWIIIATVTNIAAWLTALGWDGSPLSPQLWTITMILTATGIYSWLVFTRNLRESAAVGIWAFIAIAVKQGTDHTGITVTAIAASLILLAEIAYHGFKNRKTSPFKKLQRGEF